MIADSNIETDEKTNGSRWGFGSQPRAYKRGVKNINSKGSGWKKGYNTETRIKKSYKMPGKLLSFLLMMLTLV